MRRGDIWTVSGGKDYAGKPRPVVIVQDDSFDATDSITICAFTSDPTEAPLFRLPVEPNERNGLRSASRLMVDKITTVPNQGRRADRPTGRRGCGSAQPGRDGVPRLGRVAENGPERGMMKARVLQAHTAKNGVNTVPTQGLKWRPGRDSNP